jgi:hypothetical protein
MKLSFLTLAAFFFEAASKTSKTSRIWIWQKLEEGAKEGKAEDASESF